MISVAIVEDKRDVREGLKIILDMEEGFRCVGVFKDAESAIQGMKQFDPDVILMDIGLPRMSGIECVKVLKEQDPSLDIIMLTVFADDESVFQSLQAGAYGYLTKNTFPSKLLSAIKEVNKGGSPMSSGIARRVVTSFNNFRSTEVPLTPREKDVLHLLCEGKSYRVIADQLFVSPNTVRFHLKNIYKKLHVNSKCEAVIKASREGIV